MTFCTNCGTRLSGGATECDTCGLKVVTVKSISPEGAESGTTTDPDQIKTQITSPKTSLSEDEDFSTNLTATASTSLTGVQAGRVLGGRYQLGQCIGSGGMGEIYSARRLHIGDTVAVKVLRSDFVDNEKSRQRFYREARAAAMLHHPNAVVIHDFGEDNDGTAYIVMELLEGRSLRKLLTDEGAISETRSYGIIRQASAALDAGHRNGIVHRDIKPDNIILLDSHDGADHIKILDFGIAKLRDKALDTFSLEQRLTNFGAIIGTPHYMSPEQCQGEEADARSDIYSLGIVLYELLTGVAPFIAKTPTGIAIKHVTEKPRPLRELNPKIRPAVESVVLRALEKDPNGRQQTALELAREFEAALKEALDNSQFSKAVERGQAADDRTTYSGEKGLTPETANTAIQPITEIQPQSYDTVLSPASTNQVEPLATNRITPAETKKQESSPTMRGTKGIALDELVSEMDETDISGEAAQAESGAMKEVVIDRLSMKPEEPTVDLLAAGTESRQAAAQTFPSPPPLPRPIGEPQTKSRTPLLIGVGALLLVIAALGTWWMSSNQGQSRRSTVVEPTASPSSGAATQTSTTPISASSDPVAPEGMVYVLGGVLRIGRDDGEESERPAHVVTLKPFFIDRTEVTNEQYQKFIDATGHATPPSWQSNHFPEGADKMPVNDVTWEDAMDYAKWAGKRLPTEEEWEFAARGPEGRLYPWGNDWRPGVANAKVSDQDERKLASAGQFPEGASPFGVLDLSGNLWEWTASDYKEYPGGKIMLPPGYSNLKVIRGGSYKSTRENVTATLRRGWPATREGWPKKENVNYLDTGFRCVLDVQR